MSYFELDLRSYDKIVIIGDTHGDKNAHLKGIQKAEQLDLPSLHLGDVNMGPNAYDYLLPYKDRHFFLRGNHENHLEAVNSPNCLHSYGIIHLANCTAFFLSGAYSIDKAWRTPGTDWYHQEELSFDRLLAAYKLYREVKPDVIFSHEFPPNVPYAIGINGMNMGVEFRISSTTSQTLGLMTEFHKPKYHLAGHWHCGKKDKLFNEVLYNCLAINEARVFEYK